MSSWKLRGSANSIAMLYVRMSLALLAIYSVSMALVANVVAHCNGGGGGGGEGATGRYDNPLVVAAARLACRQTPSFRSAPNTPSLHQALREEQEQERNWRLVQKIFFARQPLKEHGNLDLEQRLFETASQTGVCYTIFDMARVVGWTNVLEWQK